MFGLTLGGGKINNPGRYLVLLPPINGANATSGTPYFTENPGDRSRRGMRRRRSTTCPANTLPSAWSSTIAPPTCLTFPVRGALRRRAGNQGTPGSLVPGWTPDLRNSENRMTGAVLVKF